MKLYYSNDFLSTKKTLAIIITGLLAFGFRMAYSQNSDSLKIIAPPQITLSGEYNDNVNLVSPEDETFKRDAIFYLLPKFAVRRPYKSHSLGLNLDAGLRKGIEAVPWQSNINTSGKMMLKFNNGVGLDIQDNYLKAGYDLGLTDMPGIQGRQTNNLKTKLSYAVVKNLKISGIYNNRWNRYEKEDGNVTRTSNIYGGGLAYKLSNKFTLESSYQNTREKYGITQETIERNIQDFAGKISVGIAKSISSYFSYAYKEQTSKEYTNRNMDNNRYATGFTWKGPNRLKLWLEGGYEEIIYESSASQNYYNMVSEIGAQIKMSEGLSATLSTGIDGYSTFAFDGKIDYKYSEKTAINLSATRKSQENFVSSSENNFYISYKYQMQVKTVIKETVKLDIGGNYQTRDDFTDDINIPTAGNINKTLNLYLKSDIKPIEKLRVHLNGTFMMQNSDSQSENIYSYDTWLGKISADYQVKKYLRAGLYSQYASRDATENVPEFDNTRYGLYVKASL